MQDTSNTSLAVYSDINRDLWQPDKNYGAHEWWYFDALSDDGSEAIVIVFFEDLVFSPRYKYLTQTLGESVTPTTPPISPSRLPAVSLLYYRGGKPVYRLLHEYEGTTFSYDQAERWCRIGNSRFRFDSAAYGSGFAISIDLPLGRGRRVEADFEWLSIEADLIASPSTPIGGFMHELNLAVPRADVTGRITVFDRAGEEKDLRHFRGTGYHDHELDDRWLAEMVEFRHRGKAHFADRTVIFCGANEFDSDLTATDLFVIEDNEMLHLDVLSIEQKYGKEQVRREISAKPANDGLGWNSSGCEAAADHRFGFLLPEIPK